MRSTINSTRNAGRRRNIRSILFHHARPCKINAMTYQASAIGVPTEHLASSFARSWRTWERRGTKCYAWWDVGLGVCCRNKAAAWCDGGLRVWCQSSSAVRRGSAGMMSKQQRGATGVCGYDVETRQQRDATWIYGYDVETRQQQSQWESKPQPRPEIKRVKIRSTVKALPNIFLYWRGSDR
jgi:hypothetical protein